MDQKDVSQIQEFLKNKNKYFHSTFVNFENFDFKKSIFGMHFGTKESALNRINIKILEDERLGGYELAKLKDNPILLEVELSIKNPLVLLENRTGRWNAFDVVQAVFEKAESEGVAGVTEEEIDAYYNDELSHNGVLMVELNIEDYGDEYNTQEQREHYFVRDWLESKGYDAIVYENEFESGGKSILAFREEQVKILSKEFINKKVPEINIQPESQKAKKFKQK